MLFQPFLPPFSHAYVYPLIQAYHLTNSCTPLRACHIFWKAIFHDFTRNIHPVFRHIAQLTPFNSILVYWYTSLSVCHFSALKRFDAFSKTSDVWPTFFSSVFAFVWKKEALPSRKRSFFSSFFMSFCASSCGAYSTGSRIFNRLQEHLHCLSGQTRYIHRKSARPGTQPWRRPAPEDEPDPRSHFKLHL